LSLDRLKGRGQRLRVKQISGRRNRDVVWWRSLAFAAAWPVRCLAQRAALHLCGAEALACSGASRGCDQLWEGEWRVGKLFVVCGTPQEREACGLVWWAGAEQHCLPSLEVCSGIVLSGVCSRFPSRTQDGLLPTAGQQGRNPGTGSEQQPTRAHSCRIEL
jgi:hypothetical protein